MLKIKENILLADLTTIHLGGKARFFCECIDEEELSECLEFANNKKLKTQVIGGGSNIIFPDNGYDGLVLKTGMKGISVFGKGGTGEAEVSIQAGGNWDDFVMFCTGEGLQGVECLSGIPGSAGATPIQNVGAYGQDVSGVIVDVTAIERSSLNKVTFENKDCKFGYRQSRFKNEDKDKYIITEVKFKLKRNAEPEVKYPELIEYLERMELQEETRDTTESKISDRKKLKPEDKLRAVRNAVLEIRKKKSMIVDLNDPDSISCGSFFMNPVLSDDEYREFKLRIKEKEFPFYKTDNGIKISAAFLIEKAGFEKGYRNAGAGISSKHTLALINCGGTAEDIINLAEEIESKVYGKFGVNLKREPVIIN